MARWPKDKGAALLTVLLIVAVMSAVAIAVMDDIRFSIRRATNVELRDQAYWYALGAERLAAATIAKELEMNPERSLLAVSEARDVYFPIQGGAITGSLRDQSNCFNLNALVTVENDARTVSPENLARYRRLLETLGFNRQESQALAAAAADWIDSDSTPLQAGAEDSYYGGLNPAYRTPNANMAEAAELRAVRGYSEEIYSRVRPFVCTFPENGASILNVNTLRPGQGPLLVMMLGEALELDAAERLIESRAGAGYASMAGFWAEDAIKRLKLDEESKALLGLRTRYYGLQARVQYHDAEFRLSSLMTAPAGGTASVVSRRFGEAE